MYNNTYARINSGTHLDQNTLVQNLLTALDEELKSATKKDREVTLIQGVLSFTAGQTYVYEFQIPPNESVSFEDDTPGDLIIGRAQHPASVVSTTEKTVSLALTENLGKFIASARLQVSNTYLIEALINQLKKVRKGELSLNTEGAMKVFYSQKVTSTSGISQVSSFSKYGLQPNHEQREAIKKSLSQDLTFIWGPPGTGKTQTLSIILDQLIQGKKRVLLTSHTNLAVDEILIKYGKTCADHEILTSGTVIRLGSSSRNEPPMDSFALEKFVQRRAKDLEEQIDEIGKTIGETQADNRWLNNEPFQTRVREYRQKYDSLNEKRKELEELVAASNRSKSTYDLLLEKVQKDRAELKKLENAGIFTRLFSGGQRKKLEDRIAKSEAEAILTKKKIEQHNDNVEEKSQEIMDSERSLQPLKEAIAAYNIVVGEINTASLDAVDKQIQKNLEKLAGYLDQIKNLHSCIERLKEEIVEKAQVVACTLTKIYLDPLLLKKKFDVLILDEASIAQLPAVFFSAATVAGGHYIISGDFRQLPPIATSDKPMAEEWLKRDIFEQAEIVTKVDKGGADDRLVMLKEQHRMHPAIADLINGPVYGGKLKTSEKTAEKNQVIADRPPWPKQPVILVDTSSVRPECLRTPSGSRYNVYHAILAVRISEELLRGGIKNVGIISPYNKQAELINSMLKEGNIPSEKVYAATVHKFQGSERECIIFDTMVGIGQKYKSPLLEGPFPGSVGSRLMNVAVSRAQGKVIFICNTRFVRDLYSDDAVAKIVAEIRTSGTVVDAATLLSPVHAAEPGVPSPNAIYDAAGFYLRLFSDMRQARKRVVIFSPFITERRLSQFDLLFDEIHAAGVQCYAVIKDPEILKREPSTERSNQQKFIQSLKDHHVKVVCAGVGNNMNKFFHEKYVSIDDSITYIGSLNVFSQKEGLSSEIMVRNASDEMAKMSSQLLKVEEILRSYQA